MLLLNLFNFLHFVGLAFGLGGATIAVIISRKAEKDPEIGRAVMKIMPSISKIIGFGLFLLIISGIGVTKYVPWQMNMQLLFVKHVLVFWIFVVGIIIGAYSKKMRVLANPQRRLSMQFVKTKRFVRGMSHINLFLWYLVTLMSAFV